MDRKGQEFSESEEKYNEDNLEASIKAILNAIQMRLPVTTDAKIRMQSQLQSIDQKNKDLANGNLFS